MGQPKTFLTWCVRFKVQEDIVSGCWADTRYLHLKNKHALTVPIEQRVDSRNRFKDAFYEARWAMKKDI